MNRSKKYLAIAFVAVLVIVLLISVIGIATMRNQPMLLQGQVEATEIRISGKLPGRIDSFCVKQGQRVERGDTLVVINSPEAEAKMEQVNALEQVAQFQNQKVDAGTRKQLIAMSYELWNKAKSDLRLARVTLKRITALYKDNIVTAQRKDEVDALYQAAVANEKASRAAYQMAKDGAQKEDKASANALLNAAKGTVNQVSALLADAYLTAPEAGEIANIFPKAGELVGAGMPLMNLIVLSDAHVVLNVREDLLPHFKMDETFTGDVPALGVKDVEFEIYYISPLGSFATWRSTKQTGSYDMRTFEIHAMPASNEIGLRPGMSVLVTLTAD
jgi:HlyD family secretion protein